MARAARAKFSCEACGKSYRIRPALAGRRARCSCGHQLRVPGSKVEAPPPLLEILAEGADAEPGRSRPTTAPGFSIRARAASPRTFRACLVLGVPIAAYGSYAIYDGHVGNAIGSFLVAAVLVCVGWCSRPRPGPR